MERYLEEFHSDLRGALPSQQHRMNARSKLGRVRSFLSFIAHGRQVNPTWKFLDDVERVHAFPQALKLKKRAITTVKVYLVNLSQFMDYFAATPPRECRLTRRQITAVSRAVKADLLQIATEVTLHQIEVKRSKERRTVTRTQLRTCKTLARTTIPSLLRKLENQPTIQLRNQFYGYLACYLSAVYGHRAGVLTNMTADELQEAIDEAQEGAPGFVINVSFW